MQGITLCDGHEQNSSLGIYEGSTNLDLPWTSCFRNLAVALCWLQASPWCRKPVSYRCLRNYSKLSGIKHHPHCRLVIWAMTGFSAQRLTRLKSNCELRRVLTLGLWEKFLLLSSFLLVNFQFLTVTGLRALFPRWLSTRGHSQDPTGHLHSLWMWSFPASSQWWNNSLFLCFKSLTSLLRPAKENTLLLKSSCGWVWPTQVFFLS